eukprot:365291-Chlamydomonas_euryale.AAC.12
MQVGAFPSTAAMGGGPPAVAGRGAAGERAPPPPPSALRQLSSSLRQQLRQPVTRNPAAVFDNPTYNAALYEPAHVVRSFTSACVGDASRFDNGRGRLLVVPVMTAAGQPCHAWVTKRRGRGGGGTGCAYAC